MKEIFREPPLVAYKKDKSLRGLLVKSRLSSETTRESLPPGTYPCHRGRCNTCKYVANTTTLEGPSSSWRVSHHITCTSTSVIYAIRCKRCSKIYVGETKRRMADRTTEHIRSIRLNMDGFPVAQYFNSAGHSIANFEISGLVAGFRTDDERKRKEENMIFRLGCIQPNGLNVTFHSFPIN